VNDGQQREKSFHIEERERAMQERRLARERRKVMGLLVIALLILVLAFLRFGRHIPWGAR
jgi:type II secretory pathway component PulM